MRWRDAFFESIQWLRHQWQGRIRHGVHSPFVFDLQTGILKDAAMVPLPEIERLRRDLLADNSKFDRLDFGAGSRSSSATSTRVNDFARKSLQSEHAARVLRGLADGIQARRVLELGTAFGITTAYLAYERPQRYVCTIEGDPLVAKKANEVWNNLGIASIESLVANFDDAIVDVIKGQPLFDLILVDGNHTYEATCRYWQSLKTHISAGGCIVFDDIYWSREMNDAWQFIQNDRDVSLTLDYFHWGVVFTFPRPQKEHYRLKLPTMAPRTRYY
jgi:predicted O-methyltransferase YrrM